MLWSTNFSPKILIVSKQIWSCSLCNYLPLTLNGMWFVNSHPSFTLNIGRKTTLILTIWVIENELIYWLNEQKDEIIFAQLNFQKWIPTNHFFHSLKITILTLTRSFLGRWSRERRFVQFRESLTRFENLSRNFSSSSVRALICWSSRIRFEYY